MARAKQRTCVGRVPDGKDGWKICGKPLDVLPPADSAEEFCNDCLTIAAQHFRTVALELSHKRQARQEGSVSRLADAERVEPVTAEGRRSQAISDALAGRITWAQAQQVIASDA